MSISKYLKIYGILILVYFALAFSIGTRSVIMGFVTLGLTCIIVTSVASILILHNKKLQIIIVLTFLLKLLVGISHYLIFYDSNYFNGNGEILRIFQNDFTSYFDYVTLLVEDKDQNGVLYFDILRHGPSHKELLNVLATFMYNSGVYAANIIPLNCMFSSLFALNIYLCMQKIGIPSNKETGLMLLLTLFPLFLDNAIFVRDIIGQFLMSIGVCLILLSPEKTRFFWLIPAAFLFYLQRTAYITVPFLMYVTQAFLNKEKNKYILYFPLLLISVIVLMPSLNSTVVDEYAYRQEGIGGVSIVTLPMRIIFSLIGPFPWWQFYEKGIVDPAYSSQLYNYFAGIIHLGCLFMLLRYWRLFRQLLYNDLFLMGLFLVIIAVMGGIMHITYVMAGTCFMVPVIYLKFNHSVYMFYMKTSFFILFVMNLLYLIAGGGIRDLLV